MIGLLPTSTNMNKKRHTKPCIYFQTNQCPFSPEDCDFVHVYDEQAMSGPDALRSKYRTKPCRYYLAGSCSQEMWCRFKHPVGHFSVRELTEAQVDEEEYNDIPDIRDADPNMRRQRELHPKYKTRPCRDWLMGTCHRGASCSYLHEHAITPTTSPIAMTSRAPFNTMPSYSSYGLFPSQLVFSSSSGSSITDEDRGLVSLVSPPSPSDHSSFSNDGPPTPMDQHTPIGPNAPAIGGWSSNNYYHGVASPYQGGPQSPVTLVPMSAPHQELTYACLWSPPTSPPVTMPAVPRARSQPPGGQRRAGTARSKPCRLFYAPEGCPKGDKCGYSHVPMPTGPPANPGVNPASIPRTLPSAPAQVALPDKPKNDLDNMRSKGYYPITWRVVGGGVKLAKSETAPEESAPSSITPQPVMNVHISTPPQSPVRQGHTRTSPRSMKTMSISIPATARLVPIELDDYDQSDVLKARSTPSSPTRGRMSLVPIYAMNDL